MYRVFTDGSSSRKDKTIGTSYIIFKDDNYNPIKKFNKGFTDKWARNGIAELLGVYYFLYDVCTNSTLRGIKNEEIVIYSDSQYVVNEFTIWFRNQVMKNFFDVKNSEVITYILFMLYILRKEYNLNIKFKWIRGHQKDKSFEVFGNNLADNLAVESRKNIDTLSDVEKLVEELKHIIRREDTFNFIKENFVKEKII